MIVKGTVGHSFYVIVSGVARVSVESAESTTNKTFTTGDYFGEQALVSRSNVRSANIVAVTELRVLRFRQTDFLRLVENTHIMDRIKDLATSREHRVWDTLDCNSAFIELSGKQRTTLEEMVTMKKFTKNQTIWKKVRIMHYGDLY